ncbi:asparagine synthase (glutamine-hydrolyzing) [Bradyrhizobium sp. GM5.1]
MAKNLAHRGPDQTGAYSDDRIALALRRLAIVAPDDGSQPLFNEAGDVVLIGNGEIYDYRTLRADLEGRGHRFSTGSDLEIIVHLYEEQGVESLAAINGQFALALWDRRHQRLLLARDQFGIAPLFYAELQDQLIFGSEIKALFQHGGLPPSIDAVGLDQIMTFPGLVSPRTMFEAVRSLPPGHLLIAGAGGATVGKFWDLEYPSEASPGEGEQQLSGNPGQDLRPLLEMAVQRRLHGDAQVGLLLSGGLDSAIIADTLRRIAPDRKISAYAATFPGRTFDESRFQRAVAVTTGARLRAIPFDAAAIAAGLKEMVWHAECPVKETYNVCSLHLARAARADGIKVLLGGEGADELFGGYPGYKMDRAPGGSCDLARGAAAAPSVPWPLRQIRYERDYGSLKRRLARLYSPGIREHLARTDAADATKVDLAAIRGRDVLHQRSYLDVKLRLADHLLGDHGDRMLYASGVEGRYPFLDLALIDTVRRMPASVKLNNGVEKYALRQMAVSDLPEVLRLRPKFGFRAMTSADILVHAPDLLEPYLCPARIAREGWFDPAEVATLRARALAATQASNPHLEDDLLLVVITFGMLLESFVSTPQRPAVADLDLRGS